MFDLFRSRDKIVRIMLGFILVVVAASMVTYLIPNSNLGTTVTDETVLVEVPGHKLTEKTFQRNFANLLQSQGAQADQARLFLPIYLNQEVQHLAAMYMAEKMGITVTDDEVLAGLMAVKPELFQNGTASPEQKAQFEQFLAGMGMTVEDASNEIRNQLLIRKLQDAALEGVVVTPKEVEAEFARRYDKAKIAYIGFPAGKFSDQVKPTDEELRKYFEADKSNFRVDPKFTYQVVIVDQQKVAATMNVTDAQLHAAYSQSMDNFRMPERIHVRHILVSTEGKSDSEKKALRAKADDLLKQLKNGADFAELAKKSSDDKGSGEKGGDLDWIVKGQMVPEFDSAAFALKPKELSGIVTSQFGYHVIQVLDKEPARVKPFEEVKAELADELKKQGLTDKVQSMGDQIRAALQKSPGSAAEIAKQFGADLVNVPEWVAGQPIPTLGASPEIQNVVTSMKPNDVSEVLPLPSDRLAVVVMNARIPARLNTFDEVKEQVRQRYVLQQAQAVADRKAKEAADSLRNGEDIEKVAKSNKLDVVTSSFFGRADSVEGLGQAAYVADAFKLPVGGVSSLIGADATARIGKDIVYKVVEKIPADPSSMAAQRDELTIYLKKQKAGQANDLMLDSILTKLAADGKLKRNDAAIKALTASYSK